MSDKAEYFGELAQIKLCNFKNMQEMIDRMIYLKTGFDNLSEKEFDPELMTPLLFKAVSGVNYENTLDSLDTEEKVSFDKACKFLIRAEKRREERGEAEHKALFSKGNFRHGPKKRDFAKVKGYNCGRMGHFRRECPDEKKIRPTQAQTAKTSGQGKGDINGKGRQKEISFMVQRNT